MKTRKEGFTLAELLIVVAIIAVLVAVAIPVFGGQVEKSKQAVDMSNMRAAYAVLLDNYLTGSIEPEHVYYYNPSSSVLSSSPTIAGYGKSHTNPNPEKGGWWTGVGTVKDGAPNVNGTEMVLALSIDGNENVIFQWGGSSYAGLKVSSAAAYQSLSAQDKVERDKILIDGIQSQLQSMTYGQLHDLFFNSDNTLKAEFAQSAVTGNQTEPRTTDNRSIGGMCVTLAESTIESNSEIGIGNGKNNEILAPSLFTAAGYDISSDSSQNYLVTSVSGKTNARIWACLGINTDDLKYLTPNNPMWNQTASTAYTYIKGAGAKTDPSISQSTRKP